MFNNRRFSIRESLAGSKQRRIVAVSVATVLLAALSVAPQFVAWGGTVPAPCPGC